MAALALQKSAPGRAQAPPAGRCLKPARRQASAAPGNQNQLRRLQAKLQVGAVDHPLEREADAVADRVMRLPAVMSTAPAISVGGRAIARKCAQCEEEESLRRATDAGERVAPGALELVGTTLDQPGAPLDGPTRAFFEPRFGQDFAGVRVHTDPAAAASALAVGARAYTVGSHVVFAHGAYAPQSDSGRRLIAHELVHTVQQGGGAPATVARKADLAISAATPQVQRVGECAGYTNKTCLGQACVPNIGKGTGFCRWSGTTKYGCICIARDQPMLREIVETVLIAALIAIGVIITVEALLALIACFASGACELAALIAALGYAGAMLVIGLLAGGSGSGASTSGDPGASTVMAGDAGGGGAAAAQNTPPATA